MKKLYFCQNHLFLMIMNIHFPMMIWLKCFNEKTIFTDFGSGFVVEWECLCFRKNQKLYRGFDK